MRRAGRSVLALALAGVFAAALAGCGDDHESPGDRLRKNQKLWNARGPADYEFEFGRSCFCTTESTTPTRIVVSADTASAAFWLDSGEPVPSEIAALYYRVTIDSLFAIVEDALDRDAHDLDVVYDEVDGYPREIQIDYHEMIADDEIGYRAEIVPSQFRAAPPTP